MFHFLGTHCNGKTATSSAALTLGNDREQDLVNVGNIIPPFSDFGALCSSILLRGNFSVQEPSEGQYPKYICIKDSARASAAKEMEVKATFGAFIRTHLESQA